MGEGVPDDVNGREGNWSALPVADEGIWRVAGLSSAKGEVLVIAMHSVGLYDEVKGVDGGLKFFS
jgi:hypothetical protein